MNDENKREIKGVKKDIGKKYTGKISSVVKKVTAIALAVGIVISAPQAIRMYNQWVQNRTLNNLASIITISETSEPEIVDDNYLEDFEIIIEEYAQAIQSDDKNRQQELDTIVEQEEYFEKIYQEIQNLVITKLGYTPENVQILYGREGFSLVDREAKENDRTLYTTIGTVDNKVKLKDENGDIVTIPYEMKKILDEAMVLLNISDSKGVISTAKIYEKLISLQNLEENVIEVNDREPGE